MDVGYEKPRARRPDSGHRGAGLGLLEKAGCFPSLRAGRETIHMKECDDDFTSSPICALVIRIYSALGMNDLDVDSDQSLASQSQHKIRSSMTKDIIGNSAINLSPLVFGGTHEVREVTSLVRETRH